MLFAVCSHKVNVSRVGGDVIGEGSDNPPIAVGILFPHSSPSQLLDRGPETTVTNFWAVSEPRMRET